MKKGLKYTLVSLGSLVVLAGVEERIEIYFGFLRQPGRFGWCWSGDYVCGVAI